MSAPKPFEQHLLTPARVLLDALSGEDQAASDAAVLEVLEASASHLGGFRLGDYRRAFGGEAQTTVSQARALGEKVLSAVKESGVPPALALSALARPKLAHSEQRTGGVYYTDFRLAQHIASRARIQLSEEATVVDPACGTGILLAAAALGRGEDCPKRRSRWLAEKVYAADLSERALRGARLALGSLTPDVGAIRSMAARWRCHDSLIATPEAYLGVGRRGFDVVLGNPPWEKLKLTRHEFVRSTGSDRHYGDDYDSLDVESYLVHRERRSSYASTIASRFAFLGTGEPDLYKPFLELFVRLVRPGGCVSVLVPAGLIRSQGTEALRRFLFREASNISMAVIENRARFFGIDTRFKFLSLTLTRSMGGKRSGGIQISTATGNDFGVEQSKPARIDVRTLATLRPDLTIPEVRNDREWQLFRTMSSNGLSWNSPSSEWYAELVREVDMTRDRSKFSRDAGAALMALVEGRMVHQHRFPAKAYQSGTGRRAIWRTVPVGQAKLVPQFWLAREELGASIIQRTQQPRAGFCDITGQTNERSMLAALIPPGVVCGNKVPTVTFRNDPSLERLQLWLAIVNSLPFDWMLRRVVTTTVNYFVLLSVPLPSVKMGSVPARLLIAATRELQERTSGVRPPDPWRIGEIRADIDIAILDAYGASFSDLETMLLDFPLMDRGQPPLPCESRSTITRDYLLLRAAQRFDVEARAYRERVEAACRLGAVPYVPAEFASMEANVSVRANEG